MTIEDPVEYVFPAVNQMQINLQADVTFATGLKSILRQDPDVILVGEIRDQETARIAVQSALTGHLVMSSLHATDAQLGAVPPARHGHRAVPGRRRRSSASSASASCAASAPSCAAPYEPTAQRTRAGTRYLGGAAKDQLHAWHRLQLLLATPATATASACTRCWR